MYRQEKIWGLRGMFKGISGNENVYIPQAHNAKHFFQKNNIFFPPTLNRPPNSGISTIICGYLLVT
jgi:hypothetical protein